MHFPHFTTAIIASIIFLIVPARALASPVINEVMWTGSDQSSSDEWVELTTDEPADLSGWTLSYVDAKGAEKVSVTFGSGTVLVSGGFLIVSHFHADVSRLLLEPHIVVPGLTLLNEKLILRLRDSGGEIVDEVNAGGGVPFAGSNPTGGIGRASMERMDPTGSGDDAGNWCTAKTSPGFDTEAQVFGTPGYPNDCESASSSSSAETSTGSFSSSMSSSFCQDSLVPELSLQSGSPTGIGKVTVNYQVIAAFGTLTHASCRFQFGDGTVSDSCNPPSHTYDRSGAFILHVDVVNQCGNTLVLEQSIEVTAASSSSAGLLVISYDGSKVILTAAMPNPNAADKEKEWIEIKNLEDRTVSLTGWVIALGTTTVHHYPIHGVTTVNPHQTLRLYQSETKFDLRNTEEKLQLLNPDGMATSTIEWTDAEEERIYKPDGFRHEEIRGVVSKIVDGDTFHLLLDGASAQLLHEDEVVVRLLGIDSPETVDPNSPPEPFGTEAKNFLSALIGGKNVELYFDTEVWDAYGRLLAYVYLEEGRLVQQQLLDQGLAETYRKYEFIRKQEFLDAEAKAKEKKAGMWVAGLIPVELTTGLALTDKAEAANAVALPPPSYGGGNYPKLLITEIYPSPPPSPSGSGVASGPADREWLEIYNPSDEQVSLVDWSLSIGKKTKKLGSGAGLLSSGYNILFSEKLGLKLSNNGSIVVLEPPDKSFKVRIQYPSVPNGSSYVIGIGGEAPCISSIPTPGKAGGCVSKVTNRRLAAALRQQAKYAGYASQYLSDVRSARAGSGVLVFEESPSSGQLFASIILSFLAGIFSVVVVEGVSMVWRRRKKYEKIDS